MALNGTWLLYANLFGPQTVSAPHEEAWTRYVAQASACACRPHKLKLVLQVVVVTFPARFRIDGWMEAWTHTLRRNRETAVTLRQTRTAGLILAALSFIAPAAAAETKAADQPLTFGVLQAPAEDAARAQALDWLKSVRPVDGAMQAAFDAVWAADRPVLDRVSDTFTLGNPEAARLLAEARDADAAAPLHPPALAADAAQTPYFRANFALAYARTLSIRGVYEQALETLCGVRPEQTVDPATCLFVRAVAEHALMRKAEAMESIDRLLADVAAVPTRYRTVAALMADDMERWSDVGLDPIAREAAAVKDRLELGRSGEKTQEMEKDVLARLDALIHELEGPQGAPVVIPPDSDAQPVRPQDDSFGGNDSGRGRIDMKKLQDAAAQWGNKAPKERAEAMRDLSRNLSPELRETVERYFKELADRDDDGQ